MRWLILVALLSGCAYAPSEHMTIEPGAMITDCAQWDARVRPYITCEWRLPR